MQGQGCPQPPYTGQIADEKEEEDVGSDDWSFSVSSAFQVTDPSCITFMSVRMITSLIWSKQR